MAQKANVKPDMATYWFNTVMYKYLIIKIDLSQLLMCPVKFDQPRKQVTKAAVVDKLYQSFWTTFCGSAMDQLTCTLFCIL